MGSSGSGNFTDYSETPTKGTSSSKTGGSSNEDKCGKAFSSDLEDVETCEYYESHGDVPPPKTAIKVIFQKPRLAVKTKDGEIIGYLPTVFNYLKVCIDSGYNFLGAVTSSRRVPRPSTNVTVAPSK